MHISNLFQKIVHKIDLEIVNKVVPENILERVRPTYRKLSRVQQKLTLLNGTQVKVIKIQSIFSILSQKLTSKLTFILSPKMFLKLFVSYLSVH